MFNFNIDFENAINPEINDILILQGDYTTTTSYVAVLVYDIQKIKDSKNGKRCFMEIINEDWAGLNLLEYTDIYYNYKTIENGRLHQTDIKISKEDLKKLLNIKSFLHEYNIYHLKNTEYNKAFNKKLKDNSYVLNIFHKGIVINA